MDLMIAKTLRERGGKARIDFDCFVIILRDLAEKQGEAFNVFVH